MTTLRVRGGSPSSRVDICDKCKNWVTRSSLVYAQSVFERQPCQNYLPYSEYDATHWTVSATTSATESYGIHAHERYGWYDQSNDDHIQDSVQVFVGNGYVYPSSSVDLSTATSFTFSAYVGNHEASTNPGLTVVMGLCDGTSSNKQPLKTWTLYGSQRVFCTATLASVVAVWFNSAAAYPYIQITTGTGAEKWFFEHAQLEKNKSAPGEFIGTSGSSAVYLVPTRTLVSAKTCPDCWEEIEDLKPDDPTDTGSDFRDSDLGTRETY